jgi:lysocardiolipin and lysophospholipid acyltransferase
MQHRLRKLKAKHDGPLSGSGSLDPMWLLIYPEGTNLSANTRKASKKWAEQNNFPDLKRQLLPRSTGLLFCLQELRGTIDWVYDCTVAYEGTP